MSMEILFEKEVCTFLNLPKLPVKEWDGESPFDKGVAIVDLGYGNQGYAIARFDKEKESKPNIIKVFSQEPFYGIKKVLIVPEYMETDVTRMDLDEESKKKAEELAHEAEEESNGDGTVIESEEKEDEGNPYIFDNITNDEEAIAFIESFNKRNGIKGAIPKKHETILMRLAVIDADLKKASGFDETQQM